MRELVDTWARRVVTVSAVSVLFCVVLLTSPLWVPAALFEQLRAPRGWVGLRFGVYLLLFLACEVMGVFLAGVVWCVTLGGLFRGLWFTLNFALQKGWGTVLFRGLVRVFGVDFKVTGEAALAGSPVVVLSRHVSSADSLLPTVLISKAHNIHLRYVMKWGLRWDPCLDIVGGRLPNCFVRRGEDVEKGVAQIRGLFKGLGPREGVVVFPEGTRFTPEKRAELIERFRGKGDLQSAERASELNALLPPRRAGTLAVLEENPGADVLFIAHTGLEAVRQLKGLFGGELVNHVIEVHAWRVPFSEIPTGDSERWEWLWSQWREMDRWVEEHRLAP